ncbi:MAG: hypothetical protein ABIZ91_16430 [Gemmatimonadaceae bacterium]
MKDYTLNLDTNHLSEIAKFPDTEGARCIRALLAAGKAKLAISTYHLLELAAPEFQSVDKVRELLRSVPWVLLNPVENVQDEEIAVVVARATGRVRRPPRVFATSTADWGYHVGPEGGGPVEMLGAISQLQDMRRDFLKVAAYGAEASMMKTDAALISKPGLPIILAVERHLKEFRIRAPSYGEGLTASEILDRSGGLAALPMHEAHEQLVIQRLRQLDQKSTGNDIFDEYIAAYAPYVTATALDRRSFHRVKETRLSFVQRVTRDLRKIPEILERVRVNELVVSASA